MEYEDFLISAFIDDLLFPERKRERERSRQSYELYREWYAAYDREYRATHQEAVKERKRRWYQANKERIAVQQRAYRRRKAAERKSGTGER